MVKPVGQTSHPSAPLWRGQNLLGFRAEFKFFVYHTMCIPYIPTTKNENDIRGSSTDHVSLARSKLCLIKRRVGSSDLCIIRLQSTANASSQHSRTSPAPACMKPHQSMPFVVLSACKALQMPLHNTPEPALHRPACNLINPCLLFPIATLGLIEDLIAENQSNHCYHFPSSNLSPALSTPAVTISSGFTFSRTISTDLALLDAGSRPKKAARSTGLDKFSKTTSSIPALLFQLQDLPF